MDALTAFFAKFRPIIASILSYTEADLPVLEGILVAVASVLTAAFPGGGAAIYLLTASQWVVMVEGFVKTIDGIIMSPEEAARIGAPIATKGASLGAAAAPIELTGDEKNAFVLAQLQKIYPEQPDHIHQLAIEANVSKARQS